jgi:hypothetical protein
MGWTHWVGLAVVLVVGYWIGAKHPGLLTKATGGMVSG